MEGYDATAFQIDPPEALILARVKVSFGQLVIVAFETATDGPISLVINSFSLHSSLSLVLAMCSFMNLTGYRHSSSAHLSVKVGPYMSCLARHS